MVPALSVFPLPASPPASIRAAADVIHLPILQREYLASYSLEMYRTSNSHIADLVLSNIGHRRSTDLGRVEIANHVAMQEVWEKRTQSF